MVDLNIIPHQNLVFPEAREGSRTLTLPGGDFVVDTDPNLPRTAIIRTSDRSAFRGCRRRWGWSSHLRHNRGPKYGISPLWFGTGIHFALEDFHGFNRFGHPRTAFEAFVKASTAHDRDKLPDDWEELLTLGQGMMDYYTIWLSLRPHQTLQTLWIDGIPQVEVNARIRVPWEAGLHGYDEVWYSLTIDRICIDENGVIWPLDYKTAKSIETFHFLTDPQINAYMWATPLLYNYPVGGFKYMQFRKGIPNPGRILQTGHVSYAENQENSTTHWMYRQTLLSVYGEINHAPSGCQDLLRRLAMREDENKDSFIQLDTVNRNERMGQSEGVKILLEIEDMLNPNLPLYPNPTRFCVNTWRPEMSCPFLSPCVSMDDGGDWLYELEQTTEPREERYDTWRQKIIWPGEEESPRARAVRQDYGDRNWLLEGATDEGGNQ
jgi:hypothetical protein